MRINKCEKTKINMKEIIGINSHYKTEINERL